MFTVIGRKRIVEMAISHVTRNRCLVYCFSTVSDSISLFIVLYRYRISLFSRWKQRGMYATCMWVVQLLLVLSKVDSVFIYIPEFYLEALVSFSSCTWCIN